MSNPYSLTFGKIPYELVSRDAEILEMIDNFRVFASSYQMMLI